MNKGWECPKCEAIMSPHHPTCFYCKPVKTILDEVKALSEVCLHDYDIFTCNPARFKCKKCGTFKNPESEYTL